MFNQNPYNQGAYSSSPIPSVITQDSIVFDGFSLQNENIITSRIDYDNEGKIELNSFEYPGYNGGSVISKYFRGRTIILESTIKSDTSENFLILLDTIKKKLRTTEGYLDIKVNDEIRRIKATLTKFDAGRQHYNVTFTRAIIEFTAVEPFFYAKDMQSYEFLAKTASFSDEITNEGYVESFPIFYIIGTSGCNISNTSIVSFGNTISIPSTLTAGGVLIVNSEEKNVTLNGAEVDYTGIFPEFPPGSNPFTISFTGTARVDVNIIQKKNYL